MYFERLQGFYEAITVEFMLNLDGNNSRVRGLNISITKELILTISRFPRGHKWFSRKSPLPKFLELFLHAGETTV